MIFLQTPTLMTLNPLILVFTIYKVNTCNLFHFIFHQRIQKYLLSSGTLNRANKFLFGGFVFVEHRFICFKYNTCFCISYHPVCNCTCWIAVFFENVLLFTSYIHPTTFNLILLIFTCHFHQHQFIILIQWFSSKKPEIYHHLLTLVQCYIHYFIVSIIFLFCYELFNWCFYFLSIYFKKR